MISDYAVDVSGFAKMYMEIIHQRIKKITTNTFIVEYIYFFIPKIWGFLLKSW